MTEPRSFEPVSWLRLERYHLGELPPEEAAEVARAIEEDPETRACFEQIQRPVTLRPLPRSASGGDSTPASDAGAPAMLNPTPEVPSVPRRAASGGENDVPRGVLRFLRIARSPAAMTVLAAAAAAVLWVAVRPSPHVDGAPPPRFRTKGGDVAIQLVRERAGTVATAPTTFTDGDRFKVLLTCPPAMTERFDVLVFQGTDVARPLSPLPAVTCANGVPLQGAFALSGTDPATVCVAWGPASTDGTAERAGPEGLRGSAVCATVEPVR